MYGHKLVLLLFLLAVRLEAQDETTTSETTLSTEETETTTQDDEATTKKKPPLDYSELGHINSTDYPTGGIMVQFTDTGLKYIIAMAERATVKIMNDFPIPDTEEGGYAVKNVKVLKFGVPQLSARFINQTGIEIGVLIPQIETSCDYSAGYGWLSTSGTVKTNIEGMLISMLVRVVRAKNDYPSMSIPLCSGQVDKFRVLFKNAGFAGTLLNAMRNFMEGIFVTSMGNVFCFAARNLTGLIDTVFLDFDKPMSEILKGAVTPTTPDAPPPPGALDMKVICGEDPAAKEQSTKKRKGAGGIASSVVAEMDELTMDLKMNQDGYFDPREVIVGLRGEFLYDHKRSGLEPKALQMVQTDRGMCFAVSQIVPNSFSVQGQNNGYFIIKKKIDIAEFPAEVRVPLSIICPKCSMQFYATTVEAPKVEFLTSGVRSTAKTFMRIDGKGIFNTKVKVVEAVADIEALVNLYIEKNTVHGNVHLGTIRININKVGISGLFNKPLNVLLHRLVPKVMWPVVEKQINKHLKQKGFKLPAVCGLSFNNSQIIYTEGNVVVCTDVVYDLDGFLNRFTEWQRQQNVMKGGSTTTHDSLTPEETEMSENWHAETSNSVAEQEGHTGSTVRSLALQGNDGLTQL